MLSLLPITIRLGSSPTNCYGFRPTASIPEPPVACGAYRFLIARLSPPIVGRFGGGVVCFRVCLEQAALGLKLAKPGL